jgi:hypothetical protein
MKVIDLLNKIANGEEVPKKIKYNDEIREYVHKYRDYVNPNSDKYFLFFSIMRKGKGSDFANALNDEVEIIEDTPKEDKRIEKLDLSDWWEITSDEDCKPEMLAKIFNKNAKTFSSKINEIIDKINGE